jgi:hypothetical protein
MPDKHPPTLDHPRPSENGFRDPGGWKFMFGFFASIGISGLVWLRGGPKVFSHGDFSIILLIMIGTMKTALAVALIARVPRLRSLGIGILVSLPVAGMIFYMSACGAALGRP